MALVAHANFALTTSAGKYPQTATSNAVSKMAIAGG